MKLTTRWIPVWKRLYLAWRKVALGSMMYSVIEPMVYMLGIGLGLGKIVGELGGMQYVVFVASGSLCFATLMGASLEALYSGFARMHVQRTWEAIINAPVALEEVVFAEWVFAACKAVFAGAFFILVMALLGYAKSPKILLALPVVFLTGLAGSGIALNVMARGKTYDTFSYYIALVLTPMSMLCGVFFPLEQLPAWTQALAQCLPLTHAVDLVRPLVRGEWPSHVALHVGVLLLYGMGGFLLSLPTFRKRLLG